MIMKAERRRHSRELEAKSMRLAFFIAETRNVALITAALICLVVPLKAQVSNTTLVITPSTFSVESGKVQYISATLLDSNAVPISGKVVTWEPFFNFYPDSVTTDSLGIASTYYWAKWGITATTLEEITASFNGDANYSSSSDASTATITQTTDTLIVPPPPFGSFNPLYQSSAPNADGTPPQTGLLDSIPSGAIHLEVSRSAGWVPDEFNVFSGYLVLLSATVVDNQTHIFRFKDPSLRAIAITIRENETRGTPFLAGNQGDYGFFDPDPSHRDIEFGVMHVIDVYPTPPQNLTAPPSDSKVTLRWSRNKDTHLVKYRIYRDTSSPAATLIDSVVASSPPDTSYTDTGLANEQIYYYRVTAVNSAGYESGYSNEMSATPLGPFQVSLLDTIHDFGAVQVDSSESWTFYIRSIGTDTLTVSSITNSSSTYSVIPTSGQIPPSDSLGVTVTFTPSAILTYPDTLRIYSNDSESADTLKFVYLTGKSPPSTPSGLAAIPGEGLVSIPR